jgi:hypothetical protein
MVEKVGTEEVFCTIPPGIYPSPLRQTVPERQLQSKPEALLFLGRIYIAAVDSTSSILLSSPFGVGQSVICIFSPLS